jgi:hypothetical protein
MTNGLNRVQTHWRNAAEGWKRLERHRTEFAVTMKALQEFLPSFLPLRNPSLPGASDHFLLYRQKILMNK